MSVSAIPWYGGKVKWLDFLFPLMPEANHLVDVFGGGGSVVLNAKMFPVRTYNDLNNEIVNFFRVLRSDEAVVERFLEQCRLTPCSREEFGLACERLDEDADPVERARRFFYRIRNSRMKGTDNDAMNRRTWGKVTLNAEKNLQISNWINGIEGLRPAIEELRLIQIENDDAFEILKVYDDPQTFFYVDPPYVMDTRSGGKAYRYEMTNDEHRRLAEVLHGCKAKVMVSGYKGNLYDEIFADWERHDSAEQYTRTADDVRQESVWLNYPLSETRNPELPL